MGVGDRTSNSDDNSTAMKNGRGGGGVAMLLSYCYVGGGQGDDEVGVRTQQVGS